MNKRVDEAHIGQGLVEYALILVLVSVVVMAILTLLGPQVSNVFSRILAGPGGILITDAGGDSGGDGDDEPMVTSIRFKDRAGNTVLVQVWVSERTDITITDDQGGSPITRTCNEMCTPDFIVGGSDSGNLTVSTSGNSVSVSYPPPP